MANQVGIRAYNTFVKGLITEATTLNFPEGASVDEDNFILLRDGSRQRRYGMDFESGYVQNSITAISLTRAAVTSHYWFNAQPGVHFSVVQVGNNLYIYDATADILSGATTITADTFKTAQYSLSEMEKNPLDYTTIKGVLFVAGKCIEPFYVTYDGTNFTATSITLYQRDFTGIDDGLAVDNRPTSLSDAHKYNLYNQGWGVDINCAPSLGGGVTKTDPVVYTQAQTSPAVYPSNADVPWLALDSNDSYVPEQLFSMNIGASRAGRGYYILDSMDRDRATVSGISGLTRYIEKNRPEAVEAFGGRVFWTAVDSLVAESHSAGPDSVATSPHPDNSLQATIWFSPTLLENFSEVGNCYQVNDPTSSELNSVLQTDGGVITIPDAGKIVGLAALPSSLLVFSEEGVWAIGGSGDGSAFAADSYYVRRLSAVGCINARTIVVAESAVLFWSEGGIYVIAEDPSTGAPALQNITATSIQSFWNADIPRGSKQFATGHYDTTTKRVKWLYSAEAPSDNGTDRYTYDRELVFDSIVQAFYKNSISDSTPYVAGFVRISGETTTVDTANIVALGHPVVATNSGDTGTVIQSVAILNDRAVSDHKYITIVPITGSTGWVTASEYRNTDFYDWYSYDSTGVNFKSYLVAGYDNFGDLVSRKQAPYLISFFNRTEESYSSEGNSLWSYVHPSGCYVQARWDFSDSGSSGKWSGKQQVYRLNKFQVPNSNSSDYTYNTVVTKTKLRGSGKVLSLYWESEDQKDCHLLGWALKVSSNASV